MDSQLQYKCPSCGGSIEFDAESQNLKCPYCDTEFEPETLAAYDEQLRETKEDQTRWDTVSENTWSEEEAAGMAVYGCRSCGGEIAADTTTGATHCPWCGSPVVLMGQFAGSRKPDLVIPFQLDKKAAKEGLKKHLSGKKLLPKVFSDENHIDEIRGVYVPVWLFDTEADGQVHPFPGMAGPQLYLHRNQVLFRTAQRYHGLCRYSGGRLHQNGRRSDGVHRTL